MHLTLVTAPTLEPVSLPDAKAHMRVDGTAEDVLIGTYLEAARGRVETATRRQLAGATWELVLDSFPAAAGFELPLPPLRSVTSITYYDTAGVQQTLATTVYQVVAPAGPRCQPGYVSLKEGQTWPDTQPISGAVVVRFVAGYAAADATQAVLSAAVPAQLRAAILLTLGELYARREDAITGTVIGHVPLAARNLFASFVVH